VEGTAKTRTTTNTKQTRWRKDREIRHLKKLAGLAAGVPVRGGKEKSSVCLALVSHPPVCIRLSYLSFTIRSKGKEEEEEGHQE
jgi:hypothetical protein